MNKPKEFQLLVDAFRSLPGVGTKNATKYAYYLLKEDNYYINEFINRIKEAKTNLRYCISCHNLCSAELCSICSDDNREDTICIVSHIQDLDKIEELNIYHGYYHVLHGELDPKKGINIDNLYLKDLIDHINQTNIEEIIIATSLSISGEMTSEYIKNLLGNQDINIYRIGFGLPNNTSIDYSDNQTLKFALLNKKRIN